MFKLLLYTFLLSVTVSVSSFAQTSPIESKPHYDQSEINRLIKQTRNQKITAWSMLGGGALLLLIGLAVDPAPPSVFLAGAGLLSMVGSVPFFISSGIKKRKARVMMGKTYYLNPAAPTHFKTMPWAGIQITIR